MKKILRTLILLLLTVGFAKAQVYLTEGFENPFTGNPAAPSGWTQTRINVLGDGIPDVGGSGEKDWERITNTGTAVWTATFTSFPFPNAAVSGSNVIAIADYDFGSTTSGFGTRRMETPIVNLASSTNPFVRFWLFSGSASTMMNLRVMASNDGGTTWQPIMTIAPNVESTTAITSASPWQRINVKIPAAFKVANAKFGFEITNTWGGGNYHIDDFSVEEFNPTTITSAATGLWSNPSTWVGGIVPNADNNVVIATGHVVSMDFNIVRCQDVNISGTLQYNGTGTTQLFEVFGNMTVNTGGTYFSGSGTTGKRTYFGGNIINNGTINFQPGTSITGALLWLGYSGNYSGTGTIFNSRVPVVGHLSAGGVTYSAPFRISNSCGLFLGQVSGTNLSLGNGPAAAVFLTEKYLGSFSSAPTFVNTNVTQRNTSYITPINTTIGGIYFTTAPQTITTGEEIEVISGNRQSTGTLLMNTHNNLQLTYPLSVGTATGTQNITLTRGIIISTLANMLTLNASAAGAVGITPTTFTSTGLNGGNHGSYVVGPIRIIFPATGTAARNFPLGEGTALFNNLPSANVNRAAILSSGSVAWNSQTITATIEGAPSGAINAPINLVMGTRAYRLNFNSGPGLAANANLQLRFNNSTFGGSDNLLGNLQDIRIIQSAALTGPWTERSATSGTGLIAANTLYTRNTATVAPGPINNGDQYFAWGSTGAAVDMAATALAQPLTVGCYGPNQTVAVQLTNSGIAVLDFAVNNATINADVSGAVAQSFAPVIINSGTLGIGATQTINITNAFNMSTFGVYNFNATVTTTGDLNSVNNAMAQASRTLIAPLGFPYSQDFNSSTVLPAGMSVSGAAPFSVLANHGANYNNNALTRNLYGTTFTLSVLDLPKLGQVTANSYVTYDYRIQNWSSYPTSAATSLANWANDSLNVFVSTNCGLTYSLVQTVNASNHIPTTSMTTKTLSLGSFAGNNVIIRIVAKKAASGTGDYYADIDNINVFTPLPDDVAAGELSAPGLVGCYSSSEPVTIKLINYGVNTQTSIPVTVVVSGALNQTLTGTYIGSLPSTGTVNFNIGNINMSAAGVYSFNATTNLVGDNNPSNDAMIVQSRTVVPALPLPFFDNFNAVVGNTVPSGYSADNNSTFDFLVTNSLAEHGTGNPATRGFGGNVYSGNPTSWLNVPKVGQLTPTSTFAFDYRIVNYSGYANPGGTATALSPGDTLFVKISTNCGVTYSNLAVISGTNHIVTNTFVTKTYSVGSFAGNDAIFRFEAKWATGDYYIDIDNINICAGPPSAPIATGTAICTGTNVVLTATVNANAQWYATSTPTSIIGVGTTYTTPILNTNTTYYVLDSAACGLSSLTPVNITVNALPSVTITPSNSTLCSGNSATLTVSGANTYSWSNSSTSSVVVVSPTLTTTYSVTGSATGCPDSNGSQLITVNPTPSVNITANNSTICVGSPVNLTASGASSYTWNTSATTLSISVTPSTTTSYTVTGSNTFGCSSNSTINITVNALPTISVSASSNTVCQGGNVTINATGANTYSWSNSASGSSISVSPSTSTNYIAYGTDLNNCSSSNTINITVNPSPTIGITSTSNSVCIGNSVTLSASGATSYTWNTSANTSTISVSPTTTAVYTVSGNSSNSCVGTKTISLFVNALPSVSLSASANTICASPGNIGLTGLPAGGVYSGTAVTGALLNITNPGTFVPMYSYTNSATGCSNTATVTVIVANCTDLKTITNNSGNINLYPNPNNGSFVVETNNFDEKLIEVTDLTGRVVFSEITTNESIKVNIYELANGLYQVRIKSNSETHQFKVIKQ